METVITFTPSELVGFLGTIAGVVSAIGLLVTYAIKVTKRMKAPMEELKRKIGVLEEKDEEKDRKIEELERRLGDGDERFEKVEGSMIIMLETLRALLEHSLGGDDSALKTAKSNLDTFLSGSLFKGSQSK